jgi:Asp/Glu/hydantoin racemase
MPKVAILHTSLIFLNVEPLLLGLFEEITPDAELLHFVDSDVLAAVMREGGISDSSERRMAHLAQAADEAGADVIFSTCSSLGPAAGNARPLVRAPIVRIDEGMARRAVERARRIGVLATVPTTLGPTAELIERVAKESGKEIELHSRLAGGAFEALMGGDRDHHDRMVAEAASDLAPDVELLVLAQASMTRLAPDLARETGLEVLTSPRLGVEHVRRVLDGEVAAT